MIIHIDKEEVTILEIKIVTLGEKDTHAYNYRKDKKWSVGNITSIHTRTIIQKYMTYI